jgi:hypothetical protein
VPARCTDAVRVEGLMGALSKENFAATFGQVETTGYEQRDARESVRFVDVKPRTMDYV